MVVFPNCKINLGLNVVQKRGDGFHNIETVFLPIPFYDVLEIIPSSKDKTNLTLTGLPIDTNGENLCLKAFKLLKKDFPSLPEIEIHLHKIVPISAGLGGGSADAAFTLTLLNKMFDLRIEQQRLLTYSLQLGSDCPFFIINKPCIAKGRGEILEEVKFSLSAYKMLLINPGIAVNTAEIFKQVTPAISRKAIIEIIQQPVSDWKKELINDFEKIVFAIHSPIKSVKEKLYQYGALYASMTGTGSTVFGIFNKSDEIRYPVEKEHFHKWVDLS